MKDLPVEGFGQEIPNTRKKGGLKRAIWGVLAIPVLAASLGVGQSDATNASRDWWELWPCWSDPFYCGISPPKWPSTLYEEVSSGDAIFWLESSTISAPRCYDSWEVKEAYAREVFAKSPELWDVAEQNPGEMVGIPLQDVSLYYLLYLQPAGPQPAKSGDGMVSVVPMSGVNDMYNQCNGW